jgi:hypothetical protein
MIETKRVLFFRIKDNWRVVWLLFGMFWLGENEVGISKKTFCQNQNTRGM